MSTSEDQIRKLLAAATPGPWVSTPTFWKHMERVPEQWWYAIDTTGPVAAYVQRENAFGPANAEFIAAAPEAVAFLLAEVNRLRAELAAAQTGWTDWSEGLGNDGIHEWSPAYECSGEFICAWRRTPAVSRKAGQWERQDVMPDNLSYPEGAS